MNRLLIVESPTKARTIGRMLGSDYSIFASMGHVRDLPERTLGVDVPAGFVPEYVSSGRAVKVLKDLRAAAKKADEIYLAPDPDREGEAIAWHLAECLKDVYRKPFHRVTFHEITRSAIENALANQGEIDMHRVDSQQARRVLDRIVGYRISPLLWSRIEKGISAGRVQSVALRLVVERERAIQGFVPEEYWIFEAVFRTADGREFSARLFKINAKEFRVPDKAGADALLEAVRRGSAPAVSQVSRQERKRNAPPPFTTSTLQQAANNAFHYTATSTMRYAQQLYEGIELGGGGPVGLITYMRTDSVNIAQEARDAARRFIGESFGPAYVPAKPNLFKSKAQAQEAHEAIRPTDVTRTPEAVASFLDASQLKLYTLIWRRFVASQMAAAVQNLTTVDVGVTGADGVDYTFRATATVPVFPGFLRVFGDEKSKPEDARNAEVLGSLAARQPLEFGDFVTEQKFTEPPPRYTEATLIKELEENGIGRPSTYATILRTIMARAYVKAESGKLIPTELGFRVTDFLVANLPELFAVGFTAEMERELDDIESGTIAYREMLTRFYGKFEQWVGAARDAGAHQGSDVQPLLDAFEGVRFAAPEKKGKRTYDDAKFVNSVREQFAEERKISDRQYKALLSLAARYRDQLKTVPAELAPQLEELSVAHAEAAARREAQKPSGEQSADYQRLFAALETVPWHEPETRRGRTYDDKKFVTSLRDQALGGKVLSERQLAALGKLLSKYRENLPAADAEWIFQQLGSAAPAADAVAPEVAGEIAGLLEALSKVTVWNPPVKRGRFTYDDQKFYTSLARQNSEGKALSEKQFAALKKLAAKYAGEAAAEPVGESAP